MEPDCEEAQRKSSLSLDSKFTEKKGCTQTVSIRFKKKNKSLYKVTGIGIFKLGKLESVLYFVCIQLD
jgi:hypothetical protein